MTPLIEIQNDIGEWAEDNFWEAEDRTPWRRSTTALLGMVEEIGELSRAKTPEERLDAVGDILIYACDFCYRESIQFQLPPGAIFEKPAMQGLTDAIGELAHCFLKRKQRIRGFEKDEQFNAHRDAHFVRMLGYLEAYCNHHIQNHPTTLMDVLNNTWVRVVSKRNWKKNNLTGATDGNND